MLTNEEVIDLINYLDEASTLITVAATIIHPTIDNGEGYNFNLHIRDRAKVFKEFVKQMEDKLETKSD